MKFRMFLFLVGVLSLFQSSLARPAHAYPSTPEMDAILEQMDELALAVREGREKLPTIRSRRWRVCIRDGGFYLAGSASDYVKELILLLGASATTVIDPPSRRENFETLALEHRYDREFAESVLAECRDLADEESGIKTTLRSEKPMMESYEKELDAEMSRKSSSAH